MRKLKLQMQITVDGFVAGPKGQLAWMTTEAGDERLTGVPRNTASLERWSIPRRSSSAAR